MTNYEKLTTDRDELVANLMCPMIPGARGTKCEGISPADTLFGKHCMPCINAWLDLEWEEEED